MNFSLSEEQDLLQDTIRGFVAAECPPQTVRAIFDGDRESVPALWKGLAEIGVAGLAVPELHGGAGLELLDLALVTEELGRGAVPAPFLGHALAALSLARGASATFEAFGNPDVLSRILVSDRAIHDTMASLIIDGVFHRHPKLRVASIENGSDWVHLLVKRLRKQANQTPWVFDDDPLETLRRHVWVTPYLEEDLGKLAELIGVERILFGSDWPHGEGLAEPLDFAKELEGFDDAAVRKIMRDNALELLGTDTTAQRSGAWSRPVEGETI